MRANNSNNYEDFLDEVVRNMNLLPTPSGFSPESVRSNLDDISVAKLEKK